MRQVPLTLALSPRRGERLLLRGDAAGERRAHRPVRDANLELGRRPRGGGLADARVQLGGGNASSGHPPGHARARGGIGEHLGEVELRRPAQRPLSSGFQPARALQRTAVQEVHPPHQLGGMAKPQRPQPLAEVVGQRLEVTDHRRLGVLEARRLLVRQQRVFGAALLVGHQPPSHQVRLSGDAGGAGAARAPVSKAPSSRMGSIGGLVTTATICLKYLASGGRCAHKRGSGRSCPIEVIGSFPVSAMWCTQRTLASDQPERLSAAASGSCRGMPSSGGEESGKSRCSLRSPKLIGARPPS